MPTAAERRDAILASMVVTHGPWMQQALSRLRCVAPGTEGMAEDFRLLLIGMGLPEPTHHNAWGALIRTAIGRGMLEPTGEYRNMVTERSHARSTRVHRRTGQVRERWI